MKGAKIKGKRIDTVFVVAFAEIMKTKMSVKDKVAAINRLYEVVNNSLTTRLFK